jgi:hypothetical protein
VDEIGSAHDSELLGQMGRFDADLGNEFAHGPFAVT